MTWVTAHWGPNISVNSFTLLRAASLIEYMLSLSHVIQMGLSFSTKNASPSCLASVGNYSTTENLILQFLSCDNSVKAGIMDWERFSIPITWLRSSSLLKRLRRTSELSSLKRARKSGRMCSFVAAFSTRGQSANKFSARALLTYWKVSVCNFLIQGTILVMIVLASRILQKSARRDDAAVRTSDSESCKKELKLGRRCSLAWSNPIP